MDSPCCSRRIRQKDPLPGWNLAGGFRSDPRYRCQRRNWGRSCYALYSLCRIRFALFDGICAGASHVISVILDLEALQSDPFAFSDPSLLHGYPYLFINTVYPSRFGRSIFIRLKLLRRIFISSSGESVSPSAKYIDAVDGSFSSEDVTGNLGCLTAALIAFWIISFAMFSPLPIWCRCIPS